MAARRKAQKATPSSSVGVEMIATPWHEDEHGNLAREVYQAGASEIVCRQGLLDCERAHLQKQLQQLNNDNGGDMLKFSDEQPAQPGPKKSATRWRVKIRFNGDGVTYNVGYEFPAGIVEGFSNFDRLRSGHFIAQMPSLNGHATVRAQDIAPSAPPAGNPKVLIVDDPSPLTSWRLTVEAMTRLCHGNRAKAIDLLYGHTEGARLWERAQFEHRTRVAGSARRVSVDSGTI